MAKLAKMPARGPAASITTSPTPDTFTRNGAPGYTYDSKSQLFLLGTTNLVGETTFYEAAQNRDDRYANLARTVALEDPEWFIQFVTWLRNDGNMRTASIVAAIEGADVLKGTQYPRALLDSALQRADEPAEVIGYWHATRGRKMPAWLKRGLGDAVHRLYGMYSAFKYDTAGSPIRFADVIELADTRHINFGEFHNAFIPWLLDRRHGNAPAIDDIPGVLNMARARAIMDQWPQAERAERLTPEWVSAAGHTWESIASFLGGPWTAHAWEAVIPSMGYMALLRNLRNFDEAEISPLVAAQVAELLMDPVQVKRSKQLPLRFLSAYNAVTNDRWKVPLGHALQYSLVNIPKLDVPSVVLIDTSTSMAETFSKDGTLKRWDAAAMFGIAFAMANGLDGVVSFAAAPHWMDVPKGASLLVLLQKFQREFFQGGGTATGRALREAHSYRPEAKRALILTDEQANGYGGASYGSYYANSPSIAEVLTGLNAFERTYTFNLAGYKEGMAPIDGRHYTIGGLTDGGFKTIAALERGTDQGWPWEGTNS